MSTPRLMRELQQRLGGGLRAPAPSPDRPAGRPVPAPPRPPGRVDRTGKTDKSVMSSPVSCAGQGPALPRRPRPLPVHDPAILERLKQSTPAKVAVGRAGLRYRSQTLLQFAADVAVARAAVQSQVPETWAEQHGLLPLETEAADHEQFLLRPDLGRRLPESALQTIRSRCVQGPNVQIVVGDGLSATAVMQSAPQMVRVLTDELRARGKSVGTPVFVRHSRAKILDVVGHTTSARAGIILLGERPGLGTGDGMSAYLVYGPHPDRTDADKQAISNIHSRGLSPEEAGRHAARVLLAILEQQTSGVGLDLGVLPTLQGERPRVNQANPDAALGCGQSHGQQCASSRDGLPGRECMRTDGRPCEACAH